MPVAKREHMIQVDATTRLYAMEKFVLGEKGSLSNKAILCIPGAGSDYRGYDCPFGNYSLMDFLARHGYRVFGVDNRGFGKSSKPKDGATVTADRCASDTLQVMDYVRAQVGCERVSLLGCSFGSIVASVIGERAPERVDKLVLIGFLYRQVNARAHSVLTPEMWQAIKLAPNGYMPPRPDTKRAALPCAEDDIVDWQNAINDYPVPNGPLLSVQSLPAVQDPSRITAPVLIMDGAYEVFATREDGENFLDRISSPTKSLHWLEGSGHGPHLERGYRRVQQLISDFL